MNVLYVLGGIVCLIFGVWQTIKQMKIFASDKQDAFGYDIKILAGAVGFIILGVALIIKYI
jgi:hypothetical protein